MRGDVRVPSLWTGLDPWTCVRARTPTRDGNGIDVATREFDARKPHNTCDDRKHVRTPGNRELETRVVRL